MLTDINLCLNSSIIWENYLHLYIMRNIQTLVSMYQSFIKNIIMLLWRGFLFLEATSTYLFGVWCISVFLFFLAYVKNYIENGR